MDDVEPLVREETACCNITTGSGGCWPQRHRWRLKLEPQPPERPKSSGSEGTFKDPPPHFWGGGPISHPRGLPSTPGISPSV